MRYCARRISFGERSGGAPIAVHLDGHGPDADVDAVRAARRLSDNLELLADQVPGKALFFSANSSIDHGDDAGTPRAYPCATTLGRGGHGLRVLTLRHRWRPRAVGDVSRPPYKRSASSTAAAPVDATWRPMYRS